MNDDRLQGSGDTCHATGKTYLELDYFNVGIDGCDEWVPFVNERVYRTWMRNQDRLIPARWS